MHAFYSIFESSPVESCNHRKERLKEREEEERKEREARERGKQEKRRK